METKNNPSGIGSGFLLGLLIGVLLTLLLTTKKGREILRELIDKVIHKIKDLDKTSVENQQMPDRENDYVKAKPEDVKKEISYLAPDSSNEKNAVEPQLKKQPEKKQVNENGGNSEKSVKRLFFQRTQNKKLGKNEK